MSFFGGRRSGDPDLPGAGRPDPWPGGGQERDPGEGARGLRSGTTGRVQDPVFRGEEMANIGKSVSIKGDLTGDEDLVIEGNVEGKIELPSSQLTIGPNGNVSAEVRAKSVVVVGRLTGNVQASDRVELQGSGILEGDVQSPRLVIAEGAVLNGAVKMGTKKSEPTAVPRPAAAVGGERGSAA